MREFNVADAKLSDRLPKLTDGEYVLEINNCLTKEDGTHGPRYIVEMTVIESANPAHPVGAQRSWNQKLSGKKWESNLKAFTLAALAVDAKNPAVDAYLKTEKGKTTINSALTKSQTSDNPFRGKHVRATAQTIELQNVIDPKTMKPVLFLAVTWGIAPQPAALAPAAPAAA